MSFWPTLLGRMGLGHLANPDEGVQTSGSYTRDSDSQITVTDERAMSVSTVWACVRLIVNSVSTLPLKVYEKSSDEATREMVERTNYLRRLLCNRPNKYMSGKQFRSAMTVQRVLWGNAYAKIERNSQGTPVAVLPLKPEHVTPYRSKDGMAFEYSSETENKKFYNRAGQLPEILHWRGFSPDGVIGLSPLAYARHTMGITVQADRGAAAAFRGRPNGVLSTDHILKADQRKKLRDLYGRVGSNEIGDGQWWLLEGGFKYQAIGLPPDDLQMLESRQFQVAEIARFYGVPTAMIDGSQGATAAWPASYEQQVLSFLTFTLKPYLEEFEDIVTDGLVLPDDDIYAEHCTDGFLRADSAARANFYASATQNGWMTRNEVRALENLPKSEDPEADKLTVQVNMATIDRVGEQDAPDE